LRWSFVGLSAELVGDKLAHDIQIFLETDKLDSLDMAKPMALGLFSHRAWDLL